MNKRMNNRNPFQRGPHSQGTPNQQENQGSRGHFNHQGHQGYQGHQGPQQTKPQQPVPTNQAVQSTRSGPCVLCQTATVLVCQRCADFYCSPTCQKKDWAKHRYICFQMPELVHSSTVMVQNMPALNGYQGNNSLQTLNANTDFSQHRKWINVSGSMSPPVQQQQQQKQEANQQKPAQQQPQNQRKQQQPQQHQSHQPEQQQHQSHQSEQQQTQKKQNRPTPPRSTPREQQKQLDKPDTNAIGPLNIVKSLQSPFPKNNSRILLTAFRSSNRVFLRSIETDENDGYCEVIKAINEYGKTAGPLKTMPLRNAFAITDFNQDGLYYRVQVVSVKNENEINVIYYDFGNEATKKLSELKEISKACAELKQYVVLAILKGVPFIKDNNKLKEYLKSFEDVEAKIVYDEKDRPNCEIFLFEVNENLNQKISLYIQKLTGNSSAQENQKDHKTDSQSSAVVKQKSLPGKEIPKESLPPIEKLEIKIPSVQLGSTKARPSQLSKPVMVPPFETVTLPVNGKNLKVFVVDNSLMQFGYFACVMVEDKKNLINIQSYLSEYQDNGRPYKPKTEEYCLAKYIDGWYRAKALSILSDEHVEVVFIDFLNESQVSVSNIRRYPMDLDFPCKTSLCMIDDLPPELDDGVSNFLKDKLAPNSQHKIDEVKGMEEEESNVVIVKMNEVLKWLDNEKSN